MNKQVTMSELTDELSQVRTKKKSFLDQIERIVPWQSWVAMIKPCYYKGEHGNKPYELELMLRIYMLQNLYDLADEATVAEVIDSRAFSEFCGIDSSNQVPDGDTEITPRKSQPTPFLCPCTGSNMHCRGVLQYRRDARLPASAVFAWRYSF